MTTTTAETAPVLHSAIVATAAPVLRRDWRPDGNGHGDWFEVLPAKAADTSRLVGGPVNLDHRLEARSQVGVIESVSVRGDQIHASLRFGSSDLARQIEADVAGRIRRQLSVGYSVGAWKRRPGKAEPPTYEAAAWTPMEISIVPVGADPAARFRSDQQPQALRYRTMSETVETASSSAATINTAPDIIGLERARQSQIRAAARSVDLGDAPEVATMLDDGTDLTEARARLVDLAASRQRGTDIRNQHRGDGVYGGVDHSDPAQIRARMATALAHRLSHGRVALDASAQEFAGASLLDLGRHLLEARGVRGFLSRPQVADLMGRSPLGGLSHSSDFPLMIADAAGKALLETFRVAAPALLPAARRMTTPDFKTIRRLRLGEGAALTQVNEHGEVVRGTITEKGETYSIATYGAVFGFTRNLLVNDDLGAFGDFISNAGSKAAATLADLLAGVLTANAVMADGTQLFHANHANLAATGTAISTTSLGAARAAMRGQTGPDGQLINVVPRYLIVGPATETIAEQVLTSIAATASSDVAVFSGGKLELLVEPRLSGLAWYLAAAPSQVPGLEFAELDGSRNQYGTGPQVETRVGFDTLGLELRVLYDVGAAPLSYQGLYRNSGA